MLWTHCCVCWFLHLKCSIIQDSVLDIVVYFFVKKVNLFIFCIFLRSMEQKLNMSLRKSLLNG